MGSSATNGAAMSSLDLDKDIFFNNQSLSKKKITPTKHLNYQQIINTKMAKNIKENKFNIKIT